MVLSPVHYLKKCFEAIIIPLNILINGGKQQEKPGKFSNNKLKLLFLKK